MSKIEVGKFLNVLAPQAVLENPNNGNVSSCPHNEITG